MILNFLSSLKPYGMEQAMEWIIFQFIYSFWIYLRQKAIVDINGHKLNNFLQDIKGELLLARIVQQIATDIEVFTDDLWPG